MQVNALCPTADCITKLTARCAGLDGKCANAATFTWRTACTHEQEFVGGSESYQAVCRAHYLELAAQKSALHRATLTEALST